MAFRILNGAGEELASSQCFARALRIMNTLDGALYVHSSDGVKLAERTFVNAATVSEWLAGLGRWAS